ncbi:hypothetical protein GCM10027189_15020 [Rufibacter soli]
MNFTVNVELAHAAGNQLGVLRPKVKDENLFWHVQRYTGELKVESEILSSAGPRRGEDLSGGLGNDLDINIILN